jgi:hypothetical protein
VWRRLARAPDLLGLTSSICFVQYINAASAAAVPNAKKKRVRWGAPVSGCADVQVVPHDCGAAGVRGRRRRLL